MSLVVVCTVTGAPGCTTLSCLLGAVWPLRTPVVVAECDPSGGALAARFGLSGHTGMTSFVLANRHADPAPAPVDPHLQRLPGGLEVLVGAPGPDAARVVDAEVRGMAALYAIDRDAVVDCGRVVGTAPGQQLLLSRADVVVLLTSDEAAAVANAAASAGRIRSAVKGRFGLAVLSERGRVAREVADIVGADLAVAVPHDPVAAAITRGEPGRARRLERSPLVAAAARLQTWLDRVPGEPEGVEVGTGMRAGR